MDTLHDIEVTTIDGSTATLADYAGKVLLIVNVASKCGATPQYAGLEQLQRRYEPQGFSVLGFPCNQFLKQEPGSEAEIKEFCSTTYDVTFPLFSKIEVNGPGRHPLYEFLTHQEVQPTGSGDIKWNFEKFLVDRQGHVIARFATKTAPEDPTLVAAIEAALATRS